MENLQKPLMIYDGDCNFCCRSIERCRAITGDQVQYLPSQEAAADHPEITAKDFSQSVQWIGVDGRRESGASAVFSALATASAIGRFALTLHRKFPPFAWISEIAYRFVARNRGFFSRLTRRL